eukprot:1005487_1
MATVGTQKPQVLSHQSIAISVLNVKVEESTISSEQLISKTVFNDNEAYLISDVDEELLILVDFKEINDLRSIKLHALSNNNEDLDTSQPKTVHIYHLNDLAKDFNDIKSMKSDKTTECLIQKLRKGQNIKLQSAKFRRTRYLGIYIESNQNETEQTHLNGITFKGIATKTSSTNAHSPASIINERYVNHPAVYSTCKLLDKPDTTCLRMLHLPPFQIFRNMVNLKLNTKYELLHNRHPCNVQQCSHLQRICVVLQEYHRQIKASSKSQRKIEIGEVLRRVYGDKDTEIKLFNDYDHLLANHNHIDEFEAIYNNFKLRTNNNTCCNLSNCPIFSRNRRDRSDEKMSNHVYDVDINNDDEYGENVHQQILDPIHCYYFHSFDIGYKITGSERDNIRNYEQKSNDHTIDIAKAQSAFHTIIKRKQQSVNLNRDRTKYLLQTTHGSYSYGKRFFYWKHYENNDAIYDRAHCDSGTLKTQSFGDLAVNNDFNEHNSHPPANGNDTLSHWHIPQKHQNLKDELLNNVICRISKAAYCQTLSKAMYHKQTDRVRRLTSHTDHHDSKDYRILNVCYELEAGCCMLEDHLVAIMVQCNFDTLQNEFRKTYRRNHGEEDVDLKRRHSNFYWLARRLRECVECFGMERQYLTREKKTIDVWHGLNKAFIFPSMFAHIKGPCSTTTEYAVAMSFCDNKGMVLKLQTTKQWISKIGPGMGIVLRNQYPNGGWVEDRSAARVSAFDCSWISKFSNEHEIFTIGGLYRFNIAEIETPTGENYGQYVKGIKQLTHCMSVGGPFNRDKPQTDFEKAIVLKLLSHALFQCDPNHQDAKQFEECPDYVTNTLMKQCKHIRYICFPQNATRNAAVSKMFMNANGWINLDSLLSVFPNVIKILFNARRYDALFIGNETFWKSVADSLPQKPGLNCIEIRLNAQCNSVISKIVFANNKYVLEKKWFMKVREHIMTQNTNVRSVDQSDWTNYDINIAMKVADNSIKYNEILKQTEGLAVEIKYIGLAVHMQ